MNEQRTTDHILGRSTVSGLPVQRRDHHNQEQQAKDHNRNERENRRLPDHHQLSMGSARLSVGARGHSSAA